MQTASENSGDEQKDVPMGWTQTVRISDLVESNETMESEVLFITDFHANIDSISDMPFLVDSMFNDY